MSRYKSTQEIEEGYHPGAREQKGRQTISAKKGIFLTYPLNQARLNPILLYLFRNTLCSVPAGHIVDSNIASFFRKEQAD